MTIRLHVLPLVDMRQDIRWFHWIVVTNTRRQFMAAFPLVMN